MTAAPINLSAAVDAVLTTTDLSNPREIAAKVAENVPAKQLRAALGQALVQFVRVEMQHSRQSNVILAQASSPQPAPRQVHNPSRKVAAVREDWQRALRDRFHFGPGADDWKPLGDFGHEDLVFASKERREIAARTLARADEFDALDAELIKHKVKRVADLPVPVLADVLSKAA